MTTHYTVWLSQSHSFSFTHSAIQLVDFECAVTTGLVDTQSEAVVAVKLINGHLQFTGTAAEDFYQRYVAVCNSIYEMETIQVK